MPLRNKILYLSIILLWSSCDSSPITLINEADIDPAEFIYQESLQKQIRPLSAQIQARHLAKALAMSLGSSKIRSTLINEFRNDATGEAHALWEKIKNQDIEGTHLRERIRAQLASNNSFVQLEEIESIPHLQIALPSGPDSWDGRDAILVTYIPYILNDVDVDTLIAFNQSGRVIYLDAKTPPPFPVLVVGINESRSMAEDLRKGMAIEGPPDDDDTDPPPPPGGGGSTTKHITITQINLDWSAYNYEPWWMGQNAELYFNMWDTAQRDDIMTAGNYFKYIGVVTPEDDWVDYHIWDFSWGIYSQNKPWRTVNLRTGWESNANKWPVSFYDGSNPEYANTLRLMEYDPFWRDIGVGEFWCSSIAVIAAGLGNAINPAEGDSSVAINLPGAVLGISTYLICDLLVVNDDKIADYTYFRPALLSAINSPGTEIEFGSTSRFRIKIKSE